MQAAQTLDPSNAALYGYAEDFASALDSIDQIATFAQTVQSLPDETPNLGSFSFDGTTKDLRAYAAGALSSVPIGSSEPASTAPGSLLNNVTDALHGPRLPRAPTTPTTRFKSRSTSRCSVARCWRLTC